MKDTLLYDRHKTLRHTRAHFDIFNALADWAVSEAGGKDKVFGTKPEVADYIPTDVGAETRKAVEANIQNLGPIADLLEGILPGWKEMLATGSKNARSLMRGEIPEDVAGQVRRSAAFKALGGGFGGSPMSRALTARDLGRTSLDLMEAGNNAAQRWAAVAQGSNAPYLTTGPQATEASFMNKLYEQGTKQHKYNVAAAPDPGAAGTFNLQTALGSMAASMGMSAAMGGMGGGGGRGMSGYGTGGGGGTGYDAGADMLRAYNDTYGGGFSGWWNNFLNSGGPSYPALSGG